MGNIFDWIQDEIQDDDEIFDQNGYKIIMSKKDLIKSIEINVSLQEFPWGEDLVIGSIFFK